MKGLVVHSCNSKRFSKFNKYGSKPSLMWRTEWPFRCLYLRNQAVLRHFRFKISWCFYIFALVNYYIELFISLVKSISKLISETDWELDCWQIWRASCCKALFVSCNGWMVERSAHESWLCYKQSTALGSSSLPTWKVGVHNFAKYLNLFAKQIPPSGSRNS